MPGKGQTYSFILCIYHVYGSLSLLKMLSRRSLSFEDFTQIKVHKLYNQGTSKVIEVI